MSDDGEPEAYAFRAMDAATKDYQLAQQAFDTGRQKQAFMTAVAGSSAKRDQAMKAATLGAQLQ